MALPPGKTQIHLTITDAEKARLSALAAKYDDAPEGWYTVMLLRFAIRHRKQAWREMTDRAEAGKGEEE